MTTYTWWIQIRHSTVACWRYACIYSSVSLWPVIKQNCHKNRSANQWNVGTCAYMTWHYRWNDYVMHVSGSLNSYCHLCAVWVCKRRLNRHSDGCTGRYGAGEGGRHLRDDGARYDHWHSGVVHERLRRRYGTNQSLIAFRIGIQHDDTASSWRIFFFVTYRSFNQFKF